jgi:hypothetical protein
MITYDPIGQRVLCLSNITKISSHSTTRVIDCSVKPTAAWIFFRVQMVSIQGFYFNFFRAGLFTNDFI